MLCAICGKKRATMRHVQTHDMSYDEYLRQYDKYTYFQRQVIPKMNDLYITVRKKFIQMNSLSTWYTINGTGWRTYGLIDKDLQQHLQGKSTIGVHVPKYKTKYMCFDIDRPDVEILERVVNAIATYVPEENIYCSWSGSKGYHVDLFFNRMIDKTVIERFYRLILHDTGYSENVVECRGHNEQAVKLPLGYNYKNSDPNTNYCCFVNKYGVEIQDGFHGYKYFLDIEKMDAQPIHDAVEMNEISDVLTDQEHVDLADLLEEVKPLPIYEGDMTNKRERIERFISEGIRQQGERHKATYQIALYLKDQGLTQAENKAFLIDWTLNKCDPALYKSTTEEIERELTDTLNSIYKNDSVLLARARPITLNKLELKEILSVKNKTLRRLYFVLYTHCSAYGDKTGTFFMTYEQMSQAGANKENRGALKAQIDRLVALGKVEVVQRDKRAEGALKHAPNRYRIKGLEEVTTIELDHGPTFTPCRQEKYCIECVSCHLLDTTEIKKCFGRYAKDVMKRKTECRVAL